MSLTPDQQEFFDWAKSNLPGWYAEDARANELLVGGAVVFAKVKATIIDWLDKQTHILDADGPGATWPDFLNEHAKDRGTSRQQDETTAALRTRLRSFEDAVTRPALLATIQAVLTAAGVVGAPAMIELPRDAAYLGKSLSETGTGGAFALVAGGVTFTPTVRFKGLPYLPVFPQTTRELIFSGASSSGNNGTFATTGVVGNGARYVNGSAVAGADATVVWTLRKKDRRGNVKDGFARAYASRGYRVGALLPIIIVMLPYGTTEAVRLAVAEAVRLKKAGGVLAVIERRINP